MNFFCSIPIHFTALLIHGFLGSGLHFSSSILSTVLSTSQISSTVFICNNDRNILRCLLTTTQINCDERELQRNDDTKYDLILSYTACLSFKFNQRQRKEKEFGKFRKFMVFKPLNTPVSQTFVRRTLKVTQSVTYCFRVLVD